MIITENAINIFTDGACSHNPGKGGAAAILRYKHHQKSVTGFLPFTTNNQMEILACILALKLLTRPCKVNLYTDSIYVKNGITTWINKWKGNNWRTSNKKPVKNQVLWQKLSEFTTIHNISWYWIKGHDGHPENEQADALARQAILDENPLLTEYLFLSYELGWFQNAE